MNWNRPAPGSILDPVDTPLGAGQRLPPSIVGVFGFLDAALPPELIDTVGQIDVIQRRHEVNWAAPRRKIANFINSSFRLQWKECPLRSELAHCRLYNRDDIADALAVAYCLLKRGADPAAAFQADYLLGPWGLLTWANLDSYRNASQSREEVQARAWASFSRFYESGDRLVRYHRRVSSGLLLVRGDRLVWEEEQVRYAVIGASPRWNAALAHFESLGGNKAFLNGRFVWPPVDRINQVTNDEENDAPAFEKRG